MALPHDHRLAAERWIASSALISEAIVLLEGHCLRDQSLSICEATGLNNRRDEVQAAGLETLRQMAMAGIGIALVPELTTQGLFSAGELAVYRRFEPPEPKRELVLAWRRSFPRGDALQELARGLAGHSHDRACMGCYGLPSHRGAHRMNIASAKVDELARRLSRLTGEDVETAVERANAERLSRIAGSVPADRQAALRKFFDRVSHMPVKDSRSIDEIIGYDADGLPS